MRRFSWDTNMHRLRKRAAAFAASATIVLVVVAVVRLLAVDGDVPAESAAANPPHPAESDSAEANAAVADVKAERSPFAKPEPASREEPRQEPDLSVLPPDLAPIADEEAHVRVRLAAVRKAGPGAGPKMVRALFDILDHSKVNETVRNEICNVLGRDEAPGVVEKLVAHLGKMVRDKGHSPLWRDYCTQHLRDCYVRRGVAEALDGIRWAASEAEEPKVRSAGLYSLGLLAREMKWTAGNSDGGNDDGAAARPGEAPDVLKQIGTELHAALDAAQHVDTRTNAVRAAYVAGRRDFIPAIRKLLVDTNEPLQLRNACASVLGQFRDPGSIPALEAAAKSGPSRLKKTAERSLKKIREQPHVARRDAEPQEAPAIVKPKDDDNAPHF